MKKQITFLSILFISLTTLQGQVEKQSLPNIEEISNRRSSFNLDEIKVRWKKAALENCTGVPCTTGPGTASFTCGTSTVADIDGNTYNTVFIGTQCWTKENLKVTKYNDGTLIPLDASGTSTGFGTGNTWSGLTTGARTVYEHNNTYLTTYGYLYNGYAIENTKKICPTGWHIPTQSEWIALETYLGGSTVAGSKLKSKDLTLWINPINSANTNSSGFSALPAGQRNPTQTVGSGSFNELTNHTYWWSSTLDPNNNKKLIIYSVWDGKTLDVYQELKDFGASIRCLKN